MAKFADTKFSYTQSFLQQLQTEWREFWFEVGYCELADNAPSYSTDNSQERLNHVACENLVESLNKFNNSCDGNILIPVPLNTLKKLFSPSKCTADDVFKMELLNEIKNNRNLSTITCNKLQKLLLPDNELEVSDLPTPSILTNFRKSAPPRLVNKKIKSRQLFDKNDLLKISKPIENLVMKNKKDVEPRTDTGGTSTVKSKDIMKNIIIEDSDESVQLPSQRRNAFLSIDKNATATPKLKSRFLSMKRTRRTRTKNIKERREPTGTGDNNLKPRYSSVYDLKIDSRDSTGLFITDRSQKKQIKPTLVCTYFNQSELEKIYQTVRKLGLFEIENNVSARTTHLICGSSKKTVNLYKAVARGCWILDKEWIFSSSLEKRWLYEERFEKYDLSLAVKENRIKRQKFGPVYRCDIFTSCGAMYVSPNCRHLEADDVKELIVLGGGLLTDDVTKAKNIVGYVPKGNCFKETWILSSIMQGSVLNITKHFKF